MTSLQVTLLQQMILISIPLLLCIALATLGIVKLVWDRLP